MEKPIVLPEFRTLQEMAEFWDTHDITHFEDQLVEVHEPIFEDVRSHVLTVTLDAAQYHVLQDIAAQEHQEMALLVKTWILQVLKQKNLSSKVPKRKRACRRRTKLVSPIPSEYEP
jgi:predicted DNA-binding ribbon-helix-helix protein